MVEYNGFPIISEQITKNELHVLLRELERVLRANIAGDVVEFGCYEGTAALFEMRSICKLARQKKLWLYDSFDGLPEKTEQDINSLGVLFKRGELKASKRQLINHFLHAGLPVPNIKKAWFSELTPADIPDAVCFAFLDGDFYESIVDSLTLVFPKMSDGGAIVVDDYQNEKLPGAARAVKEFARAHNLEILAEQSMAILRL